MASLPMRDQSSGPNTESSETIQESIFILRTAQDLALPLRLAAGWAEESAPGTPIGFKATTQLTDPQTRRSHKIRFLVQPGFEDGTVKLLLFSDSIPAEGSWRASLYEGDALRASVPLDRPQVDLDRAMGPGLYVVEIENSRVPVSRFAVEMRPFSLPEALEYAPLFISRAQYKRAESVLADAAARYSENADIQDLQMLAMTFADIDPAGLREEEAQFGVTRSKGDAARSLRRTLASAKAKFGQSMAWIVASRNLDRAAISDAVIKKIAQETASIVVVELLAVLEERLKAQSARDDLMLDAIDEVNQRLARIEGLYRDLDSRIDLVRIDTVKSDDEKFDEIKEALSQFQKELAKRNLRIPDYSEFFAQTLGRNCWNWLSEDVKKIFMESEDHYRHGLSRPVADRPDFTAGLLDLCRGLELLFNERFRAVTVEIARLILQSSTLMTEIGFNLKEPKLRSYLEKIVEKSRNDKSIGIHETAKVLYFGKYALDKLSDDAKDILERSPGPADNEQRVLLNLITAEFRNDKMHLLPKSEHKFTEKEEMQALRKLVFGTDDGAIPIKGVLDGINRTSLLTDHERDLVQNDLEKRWRKFPGVVRSLWQGFAQPTAASAAR